jgi:uncharacterized membrane protein YdjX (TVP38/TMEM64 family)
MSELRHLIVALLTRAQEIGPWGAVVLAAAYVPAAVLFIPGSLLTIGAGFLFGPVRGTIVVSLGSTAGAVAAFLVARRVAAAWVTRRVAARPTLAAVVRAVEKAPFRIILLTRLSPVFPYTVLNYALGLTTVPLRTYILASWIGMLPGTIMYVLLGSAASSLAEVLSGTKPRTIGELALLAIGLGATVVVTVIITRSARRALGRAAVHL